MEPDPADSAQRPEDCGVVKGMIVSLRKGKSVLVLLTLATIPWNRIQVRDIGSMHIGQQGYVDNSDMLVDKHRHAWLKKNASVFNWDQSKLVGASLKVTHKSLGYFVRQACLPSYQWRISRSIPKDVAPVASFKIGKCP